jgi:hypothetical protein
MTSGPSSLLSLFTVEHLLAQGANINFIPEYSGESALQAVAGTDTQRQILVDRLKERGAAGG